MMNHVFSTLRRTILMVPLVAMLANVQDGVAQLSGIRYTIAPRADWMVFDDNASLKDMAVLAGRVGFGFGEYLELSAVGRYAPGASTDFSAFSELGDPSIYLFDQLSGRDVTLAQYGADLKVNFGRGPAVPYASIGTGILRMEPDGLSTTETIYLGGSVGLLYRWQDRITFTIEAQRQQWRMNPSSMLSDADLTALALAREDFQTIGMGAYALGAGVSIDLGGRTRGTLTDLDRALSSQFEGGFSTVRLEVEPFVASIAFDETLGYREDQRMSGIATGIDFGPYLGLRGFYWRGLDDGGSVAFDDFQAYGGELVMRFGSPDRAIRPRISLGGGHLDAREGYVGNDPARAAKDRPFAMAGAGVTVRAGRYFNLHGGVKTLLASTQEASDVSNPTSVTTSLMPYGGVSFELGRRGVRARRESVAAVTRVEPETTHPSRVATPEVDSLRVELARQQVLIAELLAERGTPSPMQHSDTTAVPVKSETVSTTLPVPATRQRDWITVPVPEEGELYIRFGKGSPQTQDAVYYLDPATGALTPALQAIGARADSTAAGVASMSTEQIRAIATQAAREAARSDSSSAGTADLKAFEARLEARLMELDRKLQRTEQATPAKQVATPGQPAVVAEDAEPVASPKLRLKALMPVTGFNINTPRTLLLGVRAEAARDGSAYSILPEFVLGVGSRTTWSVGVNTVTGFAIKALRDTEVYLGPGVGFVSDGDTQLVLNLLVGARYPLGTGKVFSEFQTQDLGNNNRFLVGYRVGF